MLHQTRCRVLSCMAIQSSKDGGIECATIVYIEILHGFVNCMYYKDRLGTFCAILLNIISRSSATGTRIVGVYSVIAEIHL